MKSMLLAAMALMSTPAIAAVPGGTGASTVTVSTDPNAPTSNFETPGNTATAGYDLTLSDDGTSVIGLIQQTGGTAAGSFANLYFDLNPTVGDGSDVGFELGIGHADAFTPGMNGSVTLDPSLYTFAATIVGGLTTLSFTLNNSLFTSPIAGLDYYPGQTFESPVTLRLSQSLSYSVAGGASYGADRLGSVLVGTEGAVPEPAGWAMMIVGVGLAGGLLRRRSSARTVPAI